MNEIVILSGKGGTGKTSVAASFAVLSKRAALADADVDASNLSLLLDPRVRRKEVYRAGLEAVVRLEECGDCAVCAGVCRFNALRPSDTHTRPAFQVDSFLCEGCGRCVPMCPRGIIEMRERTVGEWMESDTRAGPLVHARLEPAGENSGKLASLVKREARRVAAERGLGLLLVDGPPGVGCSAIAALSGASLVLFVAEPTVSGLHDFERAADLARHFTVPAALCVNKWDIHPVAADSLEAKARKMNVRPLQRVRYDPSVVSAQRRGKTVVEEDSAAAQDVRDLWREVTAA
ncbi:MAG: 4Fe-4S binding protein [Elusimicrobia bacterium]|nr:4Fe-4S binding protein [Elusimicrobiota bacterium]